MVRVRIGSTWKQDPALRSALARGGVAATDAARHAVDAVALEVDGIDVAAGQAEGPILASVAALGEAVLQLLAGSPRSHVHFGEGGVELVLGRRGASALVTVVTLRRPARILARDVEVDLAELVSAVREAAGALEGEVRALHPAGGTLTAELGRIAARLDLARAAPVPLPERGAVASRPLPRRRPGAPSCTFELHDDEGLLCTYRGPGADLGSLLAPGRVVLRGATGGELLAAHGPPFLTLRDLVTFAAAVAEAARRGERSATGVLAARGRHATIRLEADLVTGELAPDGVRRPCPPLLMARAICEAAADFCGVAVARNPWHERNGWVTELRDGASERRAHLEELIAGDVVAPAAAAVRNRPARPLPRAPLGPGRMRRISFRRAWEADVGAPAGAGLGFCGDVLVAAGTAAVLGLDPARGDERWRRPGATLAAFAPGEVFVADAERLAAIDAGTGRERWSVAVAALPHATLRHVLRVAGGLAVVVGPGEIAALGPGSGGVAWRFAPPAALHLHVAAVGPLVVAGTDAGFLYGLEAATGRVRWRLRLPGAVAAAPMAHADACLAVCTTPIGGSLVALEPGTGRRRFEVPLDVTPSGPPVPFAGLLGVAGTVAGDPVVSAIDPAGQLSWEDAPPLGGGTLAMAALRSGLLAKTADGACVALDRAGGTRWSLGARGTHLPPGNAPPVVARGVALVASEHVDAVDVAAGTVLGRAPLPGAVRLLCDARLQAWAMDGEGVVTAARVETHLSVL